jgi:hypothetical protein
LNWARGRAGRQCFEEDQCLAEHLLGPRPFGVAEHVGQVVEQLGLELHPLRTLGLGVLGLEPGQGLAIGRLGLVESLLGDQHGALVHEASCPPHLIIDVVRMVGDQLVEEGDGRSVGRLGVGRVDVLHGEGQVDEVVRKAGSIAGPIGELLDQFLVHRSRPQERCDRRLGIPLLPEDLAQVVVALGQVEPDLDVVGRFGGDRIVHLDGAAEDRFGVADPVLDQEHAAEHG